jgi:glycosyltransferase involved in cell wall biosynthesis
MAAYIEREAGRPAAVIHPPIYRPPADGIAPCAPGEGLVTMINPCAVKGISIFLQVAARMPGCRFGVLPGWGTTTADRSALERLPNVEFLPYARKIDEVLRRTRVLMMPSLWYEGFGLIVMESMLRGIPVVSSDSGGLEEAKRGTGYVIPVRTIESFRPVFDEHAMPLPVVPENDAAPWVAALHELLPDGKAYRKESALSREAAERFVRGLDAAALERYLLELSPALGHREEPVTIESLSPEKRALLLQRLHRRKMAP